MSGEHGRILLTSGKGTGQIASESQQREGEESRNNQRHNQVHCHQRNHSFHIVSPLRGHQGYR